MTVLNNLRHTLQEETVIFIEHEHCSDWTIISHCERRIKSELAKHNGRSQEFVDYLARVNTGDSLRELAAENTAREAVLTKTEVLLQRIHEILSQTERHALVSTTNATEEISGNRA
jgi:DNA-binding helix-hairpin-helix protein with protein kinase domain